MAPLQRYRLTFKGYTVPLQSREQKVVDLSLSSARQLGLPPPAGPVTSQSPPKPYDSSKPALGARAVAPHSYQAEPNSPSRFSITIHARIPSRPGSATPEASPLTISDSMLLFFFNLNQHNSLLIAHCPQGLPLINIPQSGLEKLSRTVNLALQTPCKPSLQLVRAWAVESNTPVGTRGAFLCDLHTCASVSLLRGERAVKGCQDTRNKT